LAPTLSPAGVGTPGGREGYQLWHKVIVSGHWRATDVLHQWACAIDMRGGRMTLCYGTNPVTDSFVCRHKYDNNISKSYCIWKQIISNVGSNHASNKYLCSFEADTSIPLEAIYTNVVQTNVWSFGSKHYFICIRKLYFLLEAILIQKNACCILSEAI
jgi:hypothetical protein